MKTVTCPHCHKPIEFVEPADLKSIYNLKPSETARLKSERSALAFNNRSVYLVQDVDDFAAEIGKPLAPLERRLSEAPKEKRDRIMALIAAELDE